MSDLQKPKLYFPNLNGLRAIGALIVMIGHIEFLKRFWHIPSYDWFPIPGKIGVTLFFALSGFLITSLLLQELKQTKKVSLRKFYIRRILRIWPLYYTIVFLGILVLNNIGFLKMPVYSDHVYQNLSLTNILILLFILPNFTNFYIPFADQKWSIVIEEQFYLVQPLIIKVFKRRRPLLITFVVIVFLPEISHLILQTDFLKSRINETAIEAIRQQFKYLACIAIGCISSLILFDKNLLIKRIITAKTTQVIVITLLFIFVALGKYIFNEAEWIDYRIYAVLFTVVVFNATQSETVVFNLETKAFNFLGKISYGLYMYHPVCIGLAIALAQKTGDNVIIQNAIIYPFTIVATIFIAWLSFTYYESQFLKLKPKNLS